MTTEQLIILSFAFLIIALLYSSAGFGGGSSYLAVLALMNVAFIPMKSIALICNIIVVSGNLLVFQKEGLLTDFKRYLPIIAVSIPAAFLGGFYKLEAYLFFILLGLSLLMAGVLLFISSKRDEEKFNKSKKPVLLFSSAGIGFLSGLVGIGGGIFLSPILNLVSWDNAKKIAAFSSLFIFVNSIAAIAGHFFQHGQTEHMLIYTPLFLSVILGGQIGARITMYKFKQHHVRLTTALLVTIAGIKILFDHLPKAF